MVLFLTKNFLPLFLGVASTNNHAYKWCFFLFGRDWPLNSHPLRIDYNVCRCKCWIPSKNDYPFNILGTFPHTLEPLDYLEEKNGHASGEVYTIHMILRYLGKDFTDITTKRSNQIIPILKILKVIHLNFKSFISTYMKVILDLGMT